MGKDEARAWVNKYQEENPDAKVRGWLYGKEILEKLCEYSGSEGIWFFKGLNDAGEERLVMFPADEKGDVLNNEIQSLGAAAANGGGSDPADSGVPCPPTCPNI